MNKLWNIYTIGRGLRNTSIKKWEIYYFKIKIISFIINIRWNYAIQYGQVQSKNGASWKNTYIQFTCVYNLLPYLLLLSVSEEFALFNWSSVAYIWSLKNYNAKFICEKSKSLAFRRYMGVGMVMWKILVQYVSSN